MEETCSNHPEKRALSICHSCGKSFCADCLVEGEEYYYCHDKQCLAVKSKDEATISDKTKVDEKREALSSTNFKRTFFKDALLFLLLTFPLYLFAIYLIADPRLRSLSVLSLMTVFACGKALIANSVIGFGLHRLLIKTDDREKELRRNSMLISIICFFVFIFSMEKIKDFDVADNVSVILAFAVTVISLSIFNMLFYIFNKKRPDKSV